MDNEEFREKCSSLVAPHLEPFIKIFDQLFTRYGLKIPLEFWISIIFFVFSVIIYFTGISYFPLFFGSLAILLLFSTNFDFIRNKVIINKIPATTQFLDNLDNQKIKEVEKFLRDFRKLNLDELIRLSTSKFIEYPSIQLSIIRYQNITGEFLEHIINNGIDKKIDPIIFQKYVYKTIDDVSVNIFNRLMGEYHDKKFVKSMYVNFPLHMKKDSLFYYAAVLRIKIRNWFNYGSGDGLVASIAVILGIYTTINYYLSNIGQQNLGQEYVGKFIYFISLVMSFLIIVMALFVFLKIILVICLRIYKYALFIIAPYN